MIRPSRRTVLGSATSLMALTAGCLDEMGAESAADPESNDTNGTDDDEDAGSEGSPTSDSGPAEESISFSHTNPPSDPEVSLFIDESRATEWLADRQLDDSDSDLLEFVGAVDFEVATVVALEASGPNTCSTLTLEDRSIDDDGEERQLEASVSDGSDEEMACGQQVIGVGQLVYLPPEDEPVTNASVTISGADGSEHSIAVGIDTASEQGGDADGDQQ